MVSRKRVEGQGTTLSNLMLGTPLLGILCSAAPFLTFLYSYLLRTATHTCLLGPPPSPPELHIWNPLSGRALPFPLYLPGVQFVNF